MTVERPLRQRWEVTDAVLDLLEGDAWATAETLRGTSFGSEASFTTTTAPALVGLTPTKKRAVIKAAAVPDPDADPTKKAGAVQPDPDLRDFENIPLPEGYLAMTEQQQANALHEQAERHLQEEIHPYVPDAWIDHTKTKIGYEIPFTRHFYVYTPPRPVAEIAAEVRELEDQIQDWMKGLAL